MTTPQPPAGASEWEGHDPSDGAVWQCLRPGIDTDWLYFYVPDGEIPPAVDPGELAAEALGQMQLAVPQIATAPAAPEATYVGLETWLWMQSAAFEPLTKAVTAGSTTVTVTALPRTARWDLTEGTVQCTSAGRAWNPGMTDAASTDCSYAFDTVSSAQPDGVFPVSASLLYQVDWTCSGTCLTTSGSLGEVTGVAGVSAVRVTERQSVVSR